MDRFSASMIGICICGCVAVICMGFGTVSYWLVRPEAFESSFRNRRDAINEAFSRNPEEEKPQSSTGGTSSSGVPEGDDQDSDQDSEESKTNPEESDHEVVDTALSPRSPFILLSDKDKNLFWWEIAKAAVRQRGDDIVFKLDTLTANKLARRFNCTPLQVMEFFRDGAKAKWLQPNPDEK